MSVDRHSFRDAMASIAAAVNVVTTDGPAGRCGYTCTAVCSVTDDPATVLVCLNRSSEMNPVFKANGVFCVNVLNSRQHELSLQFAGMRAVPMGDRFMDGNWHPMPTGSPALNDAAVHVDCIIDETKEVGTHSVFFGRVLAIRRRGSAEALIYFNRNFHSLPTGLASMI